MKTMQFSSWNLVCALSILVSSAAAQPIHPVRLQKVTDSGGNLIREQAAYDVKYYRLKFVIDTTKHSISGNSFVRAIAVDTLSTLVLDLNSTMTVDSVVWKVQQQLGKPLQFARPSGRIWITLPYVVQKNDTIQAEIFYHGAPKVSANPPWDDGFVWSRSKSGQVWAGVACEEEGADVWWPCKDHPSDEPDSVDLFFTVPASLTCVSNGRLLDVADAGSTKTFHWFVSEPINNYCVTFYLGPYQKIPIQYQSVTGEMIPSEYWFLPESVNRINTYKDTLLKETRFLEETCGPFPFRGEKYAIAEAPYYGMEHQTIIAYGNKFAFSAANGFDYIHLHELAHEWWGNLVTARDWSDVWIHEGFATYMEALFVERMSGSAKYKNYMVQRKSSIQNRIPVAPLTPTGAATMFSSNDVYYKGAWILHMLRHHIGDTLFFQLLKRFAYPDPAMESVTNGSQCRLATTDDFLGIAEKVSGLKLDWFFNVYLRQSALPILQQSKQDTILKLKWVAPNNLPFSLSVDVLIGTIRRRVDMSSGSGTVVVPVGSQYQIDPDSWLLLATPLPLVEDSNLPTEFRIGVHPNPFNPATTLTIETPKRMQMRGELFSLSGQKVGELFDKSFEAGIHSIPVNLANQSSGVYFVVIRGDGKQLIRKVVLLR